MPEKNRHKKRQQWRRTDTRKLTTSQRKRAEMDYRKEFFRKNKGLFGCIYFCAYCYKPLTRDMIQVDHIVPLNSACGQNKKYNLVAACAKCNREKSDIVDARIFQGYAMKIIFSLLMLIQKVVVAILVLVYSIILSAIKLVINIIAAPFKSKNPTFMIVAVILYAFIIYRLVKLIPNVNLSSLFYEV